MSHNQQSERLAAMISDGQGPVMVSFYNDACADGVCGVQNDYLERLATDLNGSKARFVSIDVDLSPELVEKYQVATLPSAVLFVDGEIETRLSGLTDPGVLACAVLQHVKDGAEWMMRSGNICPIPQRAA